MSNLNQMERDFLNIPQVKTALNLTDIRRGQRNVDNAQKRKFEHSMALSVHVVNAYEWFNSDEGKLAFDEQGLSWTIEDLSKKVFGWGKSYFHKVRRCGSLDPRVVAAFNRKCDEAGDQAMRTIANLDKFGRDIDLSELPEDATEEQVTEAIEQAVEETAVETREERVETISTFTMKVPGANNVSWRLDANGGQHTTNSRDEILAAIATMQNLIG
jgi:hypothetical protein